MNDQLLIAWLFSLVRVFLVGGNYFEGVLPWPTSCMHIYTEESLQLASASLVLPWVQYILYTASRLEESSQSANENMSSPFNGYPPDLRVKINFLMWLRNALHGLVSASLSCIIFLLVCYSRA